MEFLGRKYETGLLRQWLDKVDEPMLTVLYGRRRIGKTRLVEESFKDARVWKFEGLEGQSTREQQRLFLDRLSDMTGRSELRLIRSASWTDLLILLSEALGDKPAVVPAPSPSLWLFMPESQTVILSMRRF